MAETILVFYRRLVGTHDYDKPFRGSRNAESCGSLQDLGWREAAGPVSPI